MKIIRYQTLDHFRELQRVFAPLKDFSKSGRAAADFDSQTETETVGTGPDGRSFEDFSMSQNSIHGMQNSNVNVATEEMEGGANAAPSSSRASGLPRSLFRTPEFSTRGKRKHTQDKELEHMDKMVAYLTTGAKNELDQYGMFIRDPYDLRKYDFIYLIIDCSYTFYTANREHPLMSIISHLCRNCDESSS